MSNSFVFRTTIAQFGPGQFNVILAKPEIPVFCLRQHYQHVLGHDLAFILTEHVLQHLPGQENAIIMTGHVLGL